VFGWLLINILSQAQKSYSTSQCIARQLRSDANEKLTVIVSCFLIHLTNEGAEFLTERLQPLLRYHLPTS
jgi:hypothetical protein